MVADSWVNSSGTELPGEYTLRVGLTTEEDLMAEGIAVDVAEDAIVAKDAEAAIEEIVNTKFGAEGEDITLAMFNEFVAEEFDQLAGCQDDFVNAGAVVLRRFQLEIPGAQSAAPVDTPATAAERDRFKTNSR